MRVLAVLILALAAAGCAPDAEPPAWDGGYGESWPNRLNVHVIPSQGQGDMRRAMDRLAAHVQERVGVRVDLTVASDYAAVVTAMRYGHSDLAFFGPFTYVVAHAQSGAEAFMTQLIDGTPTYYSYMIVPNDSGIASLEELRGKKVALGDQASTSSSLIPRLELLRAGIQWDDRRQVEVTFTGGHDAVLHAVANRSADAGFLDSAIFENTLSQRMTRQYEQVRVAWKSPELYQYPWAHRRGLPADLVKALQDAFLEIDDPEILAAFGATGFAVTDDSNYADVREAATAMGVNLAEAPLR